MLKTAFPLPGTDTVNSLELDANFTPNDDRNLRWLSVPAKRDTFYWISKSWKNISCKKLKRRSLFRHATSSKKIICCKTIKRLRNNQGGQKIGRKTKYRVHSWFVCLVGYYKHYRFQLAFGFGLLSLMLFIEHEKDFIIGPFIHPYFLTGTPLESNFLCPVGTPKFP